MVVEGSREGVRTMILRNDIVKASYDWVPEELASCRRCHVAHVHPLERSGPQVILSATKACPDLQRMANVTVS